MAEDAEVYIDAYTTVAGTRYRPGGLMSDEPAAGGIDPALADAIHSIKATHEDESPRGQAPKAATDTSTDDDNEDDDDEHGGHDG